MSDQGYDQTRGPVDPDLCHYARDVPRQFRNMRRQRFGRRAALRASFGDFLRGLRAKYVRRIP